MTSQARADQTNTRPMALSDLNTSIRIKNFMPYEHRMPPDTLQLITLSIRHPQHGKIGDVTAIRVQRRCEGIFLEVMDVETELFTITSAIFDKYREVRPWLVDNEYHRGSGVWGRELGDDGNLIIVLCVHIDAKYRKQGVGTWGLYQLYASEYVERNDKILCWPSPIPRPPSDQWISIFDGIVAFFRKAGYRRVGRTPFFGYSQDPEHPSRQLSYLDDFDEDVFSTEEGSHPGLSLQTAIIQDNSEKIVSIIQNAHALDPRSISLPDVHGFRPIFVAVRIKNLLALRTLISLGVSAEDFNCRNNKDHLTPLEACNADMCSQRDFEEIFKFWEGYSDISLHIKATLKRAMGHPMPPTDEEYVAQKKWGCTCGNCLEGWLSPRTLIRLKDEAEMAFDTAQETIEIEQMIPKEPLQPLSIEMNPILCYIPRRLWHETYKTFILGYGHVMTSIAQLLSRSILPTKSTVIAQLQNGQLQYFDVQAAKFYFDKGGLVEHALAAIIGNAEASFVDLSGTDFDIYRDDDRFLKTPACANDREFGIVRLNMGLDPTKSWGPYGSLHEQTQMAIDSDEDEDEDDDEDEDEDDDEDE
ncbi:Ankyrin repeat family protein [Mycena sanguinolenta]|uniref:Ankyrin repeat family protein n=1 Tax=Mycena sanguinolenta TaxID=230812 RepID=A0A8H7DJ28_9AGAR|nr:Ankyrin repeat family protein [Mycena sanguinolenta]